MYPENPRNKFNIQYKEMLAKRIEQGAKLDQNVYGNVFQIVYDCILLNISFKEELLMYEQEVKRANEDNPELEKIIMTLSDAAAIEEFNQIIAEIIEHEDEIKQNKNMLKPYVERAKILFGLN